MDTMTRQRRRFTPQQKAEAIALCQSEGLAIQEAASRLGIHPSCLGRWLRQAGIEVVALYWTGLAPCIINPGRVGQGSASV